MDKQNSLSTLIVELKMLTEGMLARLSRATYEELESFVEQRGRLIQAIQGLPVDEAERKAHLPTVQNILSFDGIFIQRMEDLKDEATNGLKRMNQAKSQKSAYAADYSPESILFNYRN